MQNTTKLKLKKPDLTDYVSVEDLNENMDILDAAVGELKEGTAVLPKLETKDKTLAGAINELNAREVDLTPLETKINGVKSDLATHTADESAHGIGNKATLLTTNKTTLVAALNELFTNANNLKSDWAGVVGSPLVSGDTSAQLKSKTQTIKNTLATNLTAKGQTSAGTETLTALVNKVANVNTGKKFAEGTIENLAFGASVSDSLSFIPKVVEFSFRSASGSAHYVATSKLSITADGDRMWRIYNSLTVPAIQVTIEPTTNLLTITNANTSTNFSKIKWTAIE